MRNFKDETIEKLCNLINYFEDIGVLNSTDCNEYRCIMDDYVEKTYAEKINEAKREAYTNHSNCVVLRDKEDGEVIVKTYDDEHKDIMMRDVSKVICFSDCDDMWDIITIIYNGREVAYKGWQPGMKFEYYFTETRDIAWCSYYPQWDH